MHRQREAILEVVEIGAAGEALRLALRLRLDAGEQGRIARADLVFGQAVDALDVEDAGGDGGPVRRHSIPGAHLDLRTRGRVTVEADHEEAARRRLADGLPIEQHLRPGRRAAEGETALLEASGKLEPWPGGIGPASEGAGRARKDQPAAVHAFSWDSSQRWVASLGPA